jgi:hypothetical protein
MGVSGPGMTRAAIIVLAIVAVAFMVLAGRA